MRSRPYRLLLATQSLEPGNGGVCRVARLIARVLSERAGHGDFDARALALDDLRAVGDLGLPARTSRGNRLRYAVSVHAAMLSATHAIYDFLGMSRAHPRIPPLGRPFLSYIHGVEVWPGAAPNRAVAAHRARRLVSNTAYTRDRAADFDPVFARADVCWLATETDEPPERTPQPGGPPVVLIVGRMDESSYKGHAELIDAWPKVLGAVPDARLVVVGRGPNLERFRNQAAAGAAAHRIDFRGFVSEEELERLYATASIFAMPSRGEGFGLVYIEAMRHSVPVVASIHDAAPEINVDGLTGFNVDLDRADELPDRLIALLRDPDLRARFGAAGLQRWKEFFRFDAFRTRFNPLLDAFLDSNGM